MGRGPDWVRLPPEPLSPPPRGSASFVTVWCSCRGAASFLATDGPPEPREWVRHCGLGCVLPPRSSDPLEL